MQTAEKVASGNFKAAFCEAFRCPAEVFQRKLFWSCIRFHLRPLVCLVRTVRPGFFKEDLEYLRQIGETTNWRQFRGLAVGIRHHTPFNRGWLRRNLKLRISGTRLVDIYGEILERRGERLAR
jgi:hypothetical protein